MTAKEILDEVQVLPEQRRELVRFINCLFDALERRGYVMGSMHGAANRVTSFNAFVVLSALEVAAEKLHAVMDKVGYPDRWRDYSSMTIRRDGLVANVQAAAVFEYDRQLTKIGKPVDRKEWSMTPPTINAYESRKNNTINFPAGILQPPYFDSAADDAANYGAIGEHLASTESCSS